ncbi:MAG: thioredoxin [Holophagaceae bacterium]|nr:thioredoxin [Holophagaceae bacterium]
MSDMIAHITDADFGAAIASGVTLVDFWAPWCGPCKAIAPILDDLAGEYGDKLKIVKINIDDHKENAEKFGVMSIPTLMLFKDGNLVAQKVGGAAKAALKTFVDQAL